jgi:hypothetical protein
MFHQDCWKVIELCYRNISSILKPFLIDLTYIKVEAAESQVNNDKIKSESTLQNNRDNCLIYSKLLDPKEFSFPDLYIAVFLTGLDPLSGVYCN